jgi:hypothetical protein
MNRFWDVAKAVVEGRLLAYKIDKVSRVDGISGVSRVSRVSRKNGR